MCVRVVCRAHYVHVHMHVHVHVHVHVTSGQAGLSPTHHARAAGFMIYAYLLLCRADGRLGARSLASALEAGEGGGIEQEGAVIRRGVEVHPLARSVLAAADIHLELDPADGCSGVGARAGARPRAQPLCPRQGALAAEREPSDLHPSGQAVVARRDLVR